MQNDGTGIRKEAALYDTVPSNGPVIRGALPPLLRVWQLLERSWPRPRLLAKAAYGTRHTTQKRGARQGGAHSRAHDRRQPEKGAVERGHCPRARARTPERARRREEATLSLLDHSFGDG